MCMLIFYLVNHFDFTVKYVVLAKHGRSDLRAANSRK